MLDRIALRGQTFGFVGTVATVVVSVADPPALDAASVVTGELVGAASVVWARGRRAKEGKRAFGIESDSCVGVLSVLFVLCPRRRGTVSECLPLNIPNR